MSDAKELVERLRNVEQHYAIYTSATERRGAIPITTALRAADWIERWAPVVSLTTELRRLNNLEAPFAEQLGMANRLEGAIDVALGEDKP